MSLTTSTLRTATGSLFGTVTASAGAISSIFMAATHGVAMLDEYVKNSLDQQQVRICADNEDFEARITEEKATQMAQRQLEVVAFCNQSVVHQDLYTKSHDRISLALKARKDAIAKGRAEASA
jgi:hypothetical protein